MSAATAEKATEAELLADQDRVESRIESRTKLALAILAGAVVVLASVFAFLRGWTPIFDHAIIELRVRDVPRHLPLVGAWSRFGWNHPGPSQYYYLSVFYWLLGRRSEALLVATIFLHLGFGVLAWWLAQRISTLVGALAAAGITVIVVTSSPTMLRDPWNPYVAIVGALALCFAAWACAERQNAGAVWLFPIGTFMVQAHIVTAPFVICVTVAALLAMWRRPVTTSGEPKRDQIELPRRGLRTGIEIAVLMWIPPVLDQLISGDGNFRRIVSVGGEGSRAGLAVAARTMSNALAAWPDVIDPNAVRSDYLNTNNWAVPVWAFVLIAAVWLAVRRRDLVTLRGVVVAVAALIGSALTVAMLSDGTYNYLAVPRRAAVVFVMVVCAGVIAKSWPEREARIRISCYGLACALLFTAGAAQVKAQNPFDPLAPTVAHLVEAVERSDVPRDIGVELEPHDLYTVETYMAMLLALERAGYRPAAVTLDPTFVGTHRMTRTYEYLLRVGPRESRTKSKRQGWQIISGHKPPVGEDSDDVVLMGRWVDK